MSLSIELIQPLMSGGRSSDITDIITNTAGGAIGYGLHVLFRPVTDWLLERLKKAE
ncbi:VanZ family protein [Acutalibacter sp. 1XD8-36]|nr:VanZ family protein [Acutalibacter sp. 1XD8-36]